LGFAGVEEAMPYRPFVSVPLAAVVMFAGACGGNTPLPPDPAFALVADPAAPAPGEPLTLRPMFSAGAGRLVGFGPVVSGQSYAMPPLTAPTTFELQVRLPLTTITRDLTVPLRYRERLTAVPGVDARMRSASSAPAGSPGPGAAVLADGRVLVAGGSAVSTDSAVFDPASGVFTAGEPLGVARTGAALVAAGDGNAYIFGGAVDAAPFEAATRVEWWDVTTGLWHPMGHLTCRRTEHTATRLDDGRILVVGGVATCPAPAERAAEIWADGSDSIAPAGPARYRRAGHTATRLEDGRILVVGGFVPGSRQAVAEAEVFDPATLAFSTAGSLLESRAYHAAALLPDGRVLVVGGEASNGAPRQSAEVWDPSTGLFAPAGDLSVPRTRLAAAPLGSGEVLVAGGLLNATTATARLEVWDPATNDFHTLSSTLPAPRAGVAVEVLNDARVLMVGGDPGSAGAAAWASVFD
jgi:N-acetylneuraminic acid mutarotase